MSPVPRRECVVGLTALAVLAVGIVALVADVAPRVASVVVIVSFSANSVILAQSLGW